MVSKGIQGTCYIDLWPMLFGYTSATIYSPYSVDMDALAENILIGGTMTSGSATLNGVATGKPGFIIEKNMIFQTHYMLQFWMSTISSYTKVERLSYAENGSYIALVQS